MNLRSAGFAIASACILALAATAAGAVTASRPDTSGTVSCVGGKCTCTAADYQTCIAVSDQFCGKNTMSCTVSPSGAVCTCTAKLGSMPVKKRVVGPRPTTASPR